MPRMGCNKARRATFVADLDQALALISGHFNSAWIIDHLQLADDVLESFTTLSFMATAPSAAHSRRVLCR